MATQYTSYWLYQKYEIRGSQEAIPVYPNVYSVDADGTMPKVVKIENDTACGYVPTGTAQYRWVNLDPSVDYYCDECPPAPQYRWVESGTTCVGYDKYQRAIKQVSYDSGATWSNVEPAEYSATTLIEANSTDCGYVPPTPTGTKLYATYRDGRTYSAACDSSTELTSDDTKPSGYKASAMTSAVIGDCITTLGNHVFSNCLSLSSVIIPNGVTSIGAYAFDGCALTSFTLPSSLTFIGESAFYLCSLNVSSGLTNIHIPSGVTYIGEYAFRDCEGSDECSLTSITVDSSNTVYDSRNNCNAIIETSTNKLIKGCKNTIIPDSIRSIDNRAFEHCRCLSAVTLPDGLTSIGNGAFVNCSGLTSIDIPDSVTSIGTSCFFGCEGLTNCTLGSGITSIPNKLFCGCYSLSAFTIPNSVTSIGYAAFWSCNRYLTSITIPSGVTLIDDEAFMWCRNLRSVTVNPSTPPALGTNVFKGANSNLRIYVPSSSVETYKAASGWSEYASRIQAIP